LYFCFGQKSQKWLGSLELFGNPSKRKAHLLTKVSLLLLFEDKVEINLRTTFISFLFCMAEALKSFSKNA
jgi:hypothetical protein